MSIDISRFQAAFFEESFEGLDGMESALLELQPGTSDVEQINTIFRVAHSIKGGGGTFGFDDVTTFTHGVETLLDELRAGERDVTETAIDVLLRSTDLLREMLGALQADGAFADERAHSLREEIEALLAGEDAPAPSASTEEAAPAERVVVGWNIDFRPVPEAFDSGNDPVLFLRELERLGEAKVSVDLSTLPDLERIDPYLSYLGWKIELRASVSKEDVELVFEWIEDVCHLEIEPILAEGEAAVASEELPTEASDETRAAEERPAPKASPAPKAPSAPQAAGEEAKAPAEEPKNAEAKRTANSGSIRVATDKVDAIVNMVGELVITQSMLSQIGDEFSVDRLEDLRAGLAQLERNTRELQENVLQIRMLPLSFAFNRFPRVVRDLANKLGKHVDVQISGEQTELDKTVLEQIGDPLVHLVRNAVDHGLEQPEARVAAGKPEAGTLRLEAFHQSGSVVIEVSDDGQGIDVERVLEKAVEKGIIKDAEALSRDEAVDLIFHPGFSTAATVSDVSGRGVGMDVVRRNIKDLGGRIEVRSTPGKGSTFSIRLPLTLAILDGQLVRIAEETYTIPLASIVESILVEPDHIQSVAGRAEVYRLRDEYIPVVRLREALRVDGDTNALDAGGEAETLLVVVEAEGKRLGLFVDELLGQQQVVIKSLEENFCRVEGIAGATILGDGQVALIIDVPGLVHTCTRAGVVESAY